MTPNTAPPRLSPAELLERDALSFVRSCRECACDVSDHFANRYKGAAGGIGRCLGWHRTGGGYGMVQQCHPHLWVPRVQRPERGEPTDARAMHLFAASLRARAELVERPNHTTDRDAWLRCERERNELTAAAQLADRQASLADSGALAAALLRCEDYGILDYVLPA